MTSRHHPGRAGFTITELMITLAAVAIVATLGFPLIQNIVYRTQVRASIREVSNLVQVARLEAIRRGAPTVVAIEPADGQMTAYVDLHGTTLTDPSDGTFSPVDGQPPRTTDWVVRTLVLAGGLDFVDPDGDTGADSIDGFVNPGAAPDGQLVFAGNGSAISTGAFRFADRRSNYFEIRVAPAATGKVQVRKYDETLAVNWDGTHWYAEGEVQRGWNWN